MVKSELKHDDWVDAHAEPHTFQTNLRARPGHEKVVLRGCRQNQGFLRSRTGRPSTKRPADCAKRMEFEEGVLIAN